MASSRLQHVMWMSIHSIRWHDETYLFIITDRVTWIATRWLVLSFWRSEHRHTQNVCSAIVVSRFYCFTKIRKLEIELSGLRTMQSETNFSICSLFHAMSNWKIGKMTRHWKIGAHCWYIDTKTNLLRHIRSTKWDLYIASFLLLWIALLLSIFRNSQLIFVLLFDTFLVDWFRLSSATCHLFIVPLRWHLACNLAALLIFIFIILPT